MATPDQIPDAVVYGLVGSRAWTDMSAVHRIAAALLARGGELRLGGCQAVQDAAMTVALSLLEASDLEVRCRAYGASGPGGNAADRDRSLLDDLGIAGSQDPNDVALIAFLALDAKEEKGRTHEICRLARERGVPVIVIPAGPDVEPTDGAAQTDRIARALHHIDRAERAFSGQQFSRHALYTVAVGAAERLLVEMASTDARLEKQWRWLDINPLVVDFAIREHRTLNLLAIYTGLERVREAVGVLVRDHAHEADYVPAFPVAAERDARQAWAS